MLRRWGHLALADGPLGTDNSDLIFLHLSFAFLRSGARAAALMYRAWGAVY